MSATSPPGSRAWQSVGASIGAEAPAARDERAAERPPFTVVLRGYAPGEVDARIDELVEVLAQARAAVDVVESRTARLEADVADARQRLASVEAPSYDGLGGGIPTLLRLTAEQGRDVVELAEQDAAALRASSADRAAEERRLARQACEAELAEAARAAARTADSAAAQAGSTLESARATADKLLSRARRESDRLRSTSDGAASAALASIAADVSTRLASLQQDIVAERAAAQRHVDADRESASAQCTEQREAARRADATTRAAARRMLSDLERELPGRTRQADKQLDELRDRSVARAMQTLADAQRQAARADERTQRAFEQAAAARREVKERRTALVGQAERVAEQIESDARATGDAVRDQSAGEVARIAEDSARAVDALLLERDALATDLKALTQQLVALGLGQVILGSGDGSAAPVGSVSDRE